jgi:hypothetical protein
MPEMQVSFLNMSAEGEGSPKKFKKYRAFIGIGVIAVAIGLSSTLAANISINAGPVEFGQGVAQTVACSGEESIIVTPATSFTNAPASVTRDATFYGGDTITVTSAENLSVGMLLDIPADSDYVITEINGLEIRMSYGSSNEGTFSVTFSPSSGTEQTLAPVSTNSNAPDAEIGASSMILASSSIEVGMLVSGPGIPANTTVVYTALGEGIYVEINNETTYSGGELTFTNSGKSSFELSDITVSGIPDSCTNKVFTIKIYDNTSSEPLKISDWNGGDSSVQIWWANGYQSGDRNATDENEAAVQFPADHRVWGSWDTSAYNNGPAIETAYTPMSSMASGAFKVNLPVTVDASRVYKITVESQDDSDSLNVSNDGWGFYDWWWDL